MRALEDLRHPKAGRPAARHVYRDKAGAPVLVACRFVKRDGRKFFVPFDVARDAWKAPEARPLYRLDALTAANDNRMVVLVEGEKCADALAARGFLAMTTFGGAMAAKKADLSPLAGRAVVIWPDLDAPGRAYAEQLAEILHGHGARPRLVPVSQGVLAGVRPYSRLTDSQTDIQSGRQTASQSENPGEEFLGIPGRRTGSPASCAGSRRCYAGGASRWCASGRAGIAPDG